jgi:hypothetical protein
MSGEWRVISGGNTRSAARMRAAIPNYSPLATRHSPLSGVRHGH